MVLIGSGAISKAQSVLNFWMNGGPSVAERSWQMEVDENNEIMIVAESTVGETKVGQVSVVMLEFALPAAKLLTERMIVAEQALYPEAEKEQS